MINVLHFWTNGSQLTFERQYVIHYSRTFSGDDSVAVERYSSNGISPDKLDSQTQYLSRVIGGKLYLSSVDKVGQNGTGREHLDIQWTATGVRDSITQGQGPPQDLVLKANGTWLPQNFDLWNDFGLKFQ